MVVLDDYAAKIIKTNLLAHHSEMNCYLCKF